MQVPLKNDAPGWLNEIQAWLEANTPKEKKFSIKTTPWDSVDVGVKRQWVRIDDATYDADSGDTTAKGEIYYKTGDGAYKKCEAKFDLDVKYNVITKDLNKAKLVKTTPLGDIDIDLKRIKEVFEGNWSAALDMTPNGGKFTRKIHSEYDDRRKWYQDKYGKDSIYFASSDFVRWATPVTAVKYIAVLIASSGSAATAIAAEVKSQVRKELGHIISWLHLELKSVTSFSR